MLGTLPTADLLLRLHTESDENTTEDENIMQEE